MVPPLQRVRAPHRGLPSPTAATPPGPLPDLWLQPHGRCVPSALRPNVGVSVGRPSDAASFSASQCGRDRVVRCIAVLPRCVSGCERYPAGGGTPPLPAPRAAAPRAGCHGAGARITIVCRWISRCRGYGCNNRDRRLRRCTPSLVEGSQLQRLFLFSIVHRTRKDI